MTDQESPEVVFEWDKETPIPDGCKPTWTGSDLPFWFNMMSTVTDDGKRTVKVCSSFCDALRMGYILRVPYDIHYERTDDGLTVETDDDVDFEPTVYGRTEPQQDSNSSFERPEITIPTPWKINTPENTVSFITYLMNRPSNPVKSYSMLIDTDEYDGRIPIPASFTENGEGTIEAGTGIAQVIPLWESGIERNWELKDVNDSPSEISDWIAENSRQTQVVRGFYRRFCWNPKQPHRVKGTLSAEEIADIDLNELLVDEYTHDGDESPFDPDETDIHDGDPSMYIDGIDLYTEDEQLRPKPAAEFGIPDWIEDPDVLSVNGEQEERIRKWARDSFDLGYIVPMTIPNQYSIGEDDFEYTIPSDRLYDDEEVRESDDERTDYGGIGTHPPGRFGTDLSNFPIPFQIIRLSTQLSFITPDGYSVLLREPVNHRQQIYRSWAGWADSDSYVVDGNTIGNIEVIDSPGTYTTERGEPSYMIMAIHRDAVLSPAKVVE